MKKILAVGCSDRSAVADVIRSNGGLVKKKNQYIASSGLVEITFQRVENLNDVNFEDYDVICASYTAVRTNYGPTLEASGKLSGKSLLYEVQVAMFGLSDVYSISGFLPDIKIYRKRVLGCDYKQALGYKDTYPTQNAAVMGAKDKLERYIVEEEERIKRAQKMIKSLRDKFIAE